MCKDNTFFYNSPNKSADTYIKNAVSAQRAFFCATNITTFQRFRIKNKENVVNLRRKFE